MNFFEGHTDHFRQELASQVDIAFEADPRSLQRILQNRELSPSVLRFKSSLTPASTLKHDKELEYFEGKNGTVFCRPKRGMPGSSEKQGKRGFERGILVGVLPKRQAPTAKSNVTSEKKLVPFPRVTLRQSISERKAVPGLDKGFSLLPKPVRAKKGLQFGSNPGVIKSSEFEECGSNDENGQNESFDFPKPLPMDIFDKLQKSSQVHKPSLAEIIMARESLVGFPRESFSVLFRQSLSRAELDRMFEDDSTGSFEKFEQRLKTPKRPVHKLVNPFGRDSASLVKPVNTSEIDATMLVTDTDASVCDKSAQMQPVNPSGSDINLKKTEGESTSAKPVKTNSSDELKLKTAPDAAQKPVNTSLGDCINQKKVEEANAITKPVKTRPGDEVKPKASNEVMVVQKPGNTSGNDCINVKKAQGANAISKPVKTCPSDQTRQKTCNDNQKPVNACTSDDMTHKKTERTNTISKAVKTIRNEVGKEVKATKKQALDDPVQSTKSIQSESNKQSGMSIQLDSTKQSKKSIQSISSNLMTGNQPRKSIQPNPANPMPANQSRKSISTTQSRKSMQAKTDSEKWIQVDSTKTNANPSINPIVNPIGNSTDNPINLQTQTESWIQKDESYQSDGSDQDLGSIQSPNGIDYTEEDLQNIEIIEYEFDDSQMSLKDLSMFNRSLSLADLHQNDEDQSEIGSVFLKRCESETNLIDEETADESVNNFLQEAITDLQKYRQEQAEIERQLGSLMMESLRRKNQFKQVWGVSPRSINQKRSLKTVLSAHEISFSTDTVQHNEIEDDRISADADPNTESSFDPNAEIFGCKQSGDIENIFQAVTRCDENSEKDCSDFLESADELLPSLDVSVPSDLFSRYIEANFPTVLDDLSQFQSNIEDLFSRSNVEEQESENLKTEFDDCQISTDDDCETRHDQPKVTREVRQIENEECEISNDDLRFPNEDRKMPSEENDIPTISGERCDTSSGDDEISKKDGVFVHQDLKTILQSRNISPKDLEIAEKDYDSFGEDTEMASQSVGNYSISYNDTPSFNRYPNEINDASGEQDIEDEINASGSYYENHNHDVIGEVDMDLEPITEPQGDLGEQFQGDLTPTSQGEESNPDPRIEFQTLIAAAKLFKKDLKKKQKTVRFLTPEKKFDISSEDSDEYSNSYNCDEKENPTDCSISVNIPVQIGKTRGNISFNESGVYSRSGITHTPVPKSAHFRMSLQDFSDEDMEDNDDGSLGLSRILPTPMALRDISNRAQQSLASLYADSPNVSDPEVEIGFSPKKLFTEESEDITE